LFIALGATTVGPDFAGERGESEGKEPKALEPCESFDGGREDRSNRRLRLSDVACDEVSQSRLLDVAVDTGLVGRLKGQARDQIDPGLSVEEWKDERST